MSSPLPGPFFELARAGLIDAAELAPLLERLPDEQIVSTAARDGEAYDSTRWPLVCNAQIADELVARLPDTRGIFAVMRTRLRGCAGRLDLLTALQRELFARWFASMGASFEQLVQVLPSAGERERALLGEPPWDAGAAQLALWWVTSHQSAAEGLFAFHVHRRLPGPGAEACAWLARHALEQGCIDRAALVQLAIDVRARSA